LQVLSNVAQVGSYRLPPALRSLYQGVALMQLQGITLPPACFSGYLFSTQVATIGLGTGMWLLAFFVAGLRNRIPDRVWRPIVTLFISLAVYLHPTSTSSAMTLLNCRSVQLSTSAVAAVEDSSGSSVATVIFGDEGVYVRDDPEDPTSRTLFRDWVCGLRNSDKKDLLQADAP
jgi:hypothetical protein